MINFMIYATLSWFLIKSREEPFLYTRSAMVITNLIAVATIWISGLRLIREINRQMKSIYTKKIKWVVGL